MKENRNKTLRENKNLDILFGIFLFITILFSLQGCAIQRARKLITQAELEQVRPENPQQLQHVVSLYTQAMNIYRQKGKNTAVANIHEKLARLLKKNNPDTSRKHWESAVEIWYKQAKPKDETRALSAWYASFNEKQIQQKEPTVKKILQRLISISEMKDDEKMKFHWILERFSCFGNVSDRKKLISLAKKIKSPSINKKLQFLEARKFAIDGNLLHGEKLFMEIINDKNIGLSNREELQLRIEFLPITANLFEQRVNEELMRIISLLSQVQSVEKVFKTQKIVLKLLKENVRFDFLGFEKACIDNLISFLSVEQKIDFNINFVIAARLIGISGEKEFQHAIELYSPKLDPSIINNLAKTGILLKHYDKAISLLLPLIQKKININVKERQKAFLLLAEANIALKKNMESKNYITSGAEEIAVDNYLTKFNYFTRAADMLSRYGYNKDGIEFLQQLERNIPHIKQNLEVHSKFLESQSKLNFLLGDYVQSLNDVYNEFALFSSLSGYELKKTDIYMRIGDYSIKSGYIDQKFNPYDLAKTFTKDVKLQGLTSELIYKKALSLLNAKNIRSGIIIKTYENWIESLGPHLLASRLLEHQRFGQIAEFMTKYSYDDLAFTCLDYEQIRNKIRYNISENSPTIAALNGLFDEKKRVNEALLWEQLGLLEKAKQLLFEDIIEELHLSFEKQFYSERKIQKWNDYQKKCLEFEGKFMKTRFASWYSLKKHQGNIMKLLQKIPPKTLLIQYFVQNEQLYVYSFYNHQIAFQGQMPLHLRGNELKEFVRQPDNVALLIEKSMKKSRDFKKLIIVTGTILAKVQFNELLNLSCFKKRIKHLNQIVSITELMDAA